MMWPPATSVDEDRVDGLLPLHRAEARRVGQKYTAPPTWWEGEGGGERVVAIHVVGGWGRGAGGVRVCCGQPPARGRGGGGDSVVATQIAEVRKRGGVIAGVCMP